MSHKKPHRLYIFLPFIPLFFLLGTAQGAEQTTTLPPDLARIHHAGVIRVALTREDSAPFFEQQASGLHGLDIELARDVARELGVRVEFNREAANWDGVIDVIDSRHADVAIAALSRTLLRAERVAYTQPYVVVSQALLVNRLKLADLDTRGDSLTRLNDPSVHIGTLEGSSYANFATTAFPAAKVALYRQWNDGLDALLTGRIHALMFDALLCKRTLSASPEMAIQLQLLITRRPDPIAMAVNWQDPQLLRWLNVYIDTIRSDGFLQALEKKYLGQGAQYVDK